jgi:hypothetical protein
MLLQGKQEGKQGGRQGRELSRRNLCKVEFKIASGNFIVLPSLPFMSQLMHDLSAVKLIRLYIQNGSVRCTSCRALGLF